MTESVGLSKEEAAKLVERVRAAAEERPVPRMVQPLFGVRMPDETTEAVMACNEWLRMGRARTVVGLIAKYEKSEDGMPREPLATATVRYWFRHFDWRRRAEMCDADEDARLTAVHREIMETGLAKTPERVLALKNLYYQVLPHLFLKRRAKRRGKGEDADAGDERASEPEQTLNVDALQQLRGILADLAEETGGRVKNAVIGLSSETSKFIEAMQGAYESRHPELGSGEEGGAVIEGECRDVSAAVPGMDVHIEPQRGLSGVQGDGSRDGHLPVPQPDGLCGGEGQPSATE